jgi:hypothetical protein
MSSASRNSGSFTVKRCLALLLAAVLAHRLDLQRALTDRGPDAADRLTGRIPSAACAAARHAGVR